MTVLVCKLSDKGESEVSVCVSLLKDGMYIYYYYYYEFATVVSLLTLGEGCKTGTCKVKDYEASKHTEIY